MNIILSCVAINSSQNCYAFAKNDTPYIIILSYVKLLIFSLNVVTHLRRIVTHLRNFKPVSYPIFRAFIELFTCTKYNKYKEIIINTFYAQKFSKTKVIKSKKKCLLGIVK